MLFRIAEYQHQLAADVLSNRPLKVGHALVETQRQRVIQVDVPKCRNNVDNDKWWWLNDHIAFDLLNDLFP